MIEIEKLDFILPNDYPILNNCSVKMMKSNMLFIALYQSEKYFDTQWIYDVIVTLKECLESLNIWFNNQYDFKKQLSKLESYVYLNNKVSLKLYDEIRVINWVIYVKFTKQHTQIIPNNILKTFINSLNMSEGNK